jgi:hypothetical protein
VPCNIDGVYVVGGGLLWATGLCIVVVVMPSCVLVPPLPCPLIPLAQPIVQRRKETDSEMK